MMSGMMFEYVDAAAPPLRCPTCLTPGRVLLPLHEASRAYSTLLAGLHSYDQIMDFVSTARICWECHSFLSKMVKFQRQVFDADSMLRSGVAMTKCDTVPTFSRLVNSATKLDYNLELKHESDVLSDDDVWDVAADAADDVGGCVKLECEAAPATDAKDKREEERKRVKRKNKKREGKKARARREKEKEKKEKVKKSKWPGKKVLLTGDNKNVKIVSVAVSEEEFQRYRDEDRKKKQYINAPHKCETCIKGFACVAMLEKHITNCHSNANGTFECPVCGMHFRTQKLMMRHRRGHYRLYVCSVCGFPHRHLTKVLRHYHAAHEPGKTFPCEQCPQVFESSRKMRYHREITHKEVHQCEYCDKVLCNAQSLRVHLLIHTGMPTLVCSICQKSCRGETGLYAHMRTAHNPNTEDAFCRECDIQFKNKNIYRTHLKISPKHNSPAQFKFPCEKCKKRFLTQALLNDHHRKYHLDYTCHICQKQLASWYSLDKHIKFVHEGRQLPKKYICEVCEKAFTTKAMLTQHRNIHTGERPHACDICGARFAQKSTLQTHQKLIHFKLGKNRSQQQQQQQQQQLQQQQQQQQQVVPPPPPVLTAVYPPHPQPTHPQY